MHQDTIRPLALAIQVVAAVGCASGGYCFADVPDGSSGSLRLSRGSHGNGSSATWRQKVLWKHQEYELEPGIEVLMEVIRDEEERARPWNADTAFSSLAMLGPNLRGRSCLDELAKLYDSANLSEKRGIITCFITSGDPRGIPVFTSALNDEPPIDLRLTAARGLAAWNARAGVGGLVELLESNEFVQHLAGTPIVGHNALETFRTYNDRKGWGFPENEWWQSIDARTDLDEDEKRALYNIEIQKEVEEIKKWWAENKDRFPDWKPGDPLPEVPGPATNKSGDE